jgi:transposase-like protein
MPTSYPAEFRRRAIALVRSGWSVTKTAQDLDITTTTIYNWVKQDRVDRGEIPGVSTKESKEIVRARRRIRELETEVEILRRAHELLGKDVLRPIGPTR